MCVDSNSWRTRNKSKIICHHACWILTALLKHDVRLYISPDYFHWFGIARLFLASGLQWIAYSTGDEELIMEKFYAFLKQHTWGWRKEPHVKFKNSTLHPVNTSIGFKQGCGVRCPVIRLRLRAISIIRLWLQLPLQTDSDLQLY